MLLKYPQSSLSILITSVLNLHLIDCLFPFRLVIFLEFKSVLLFGLSFFVSSFWQPPCVCLYILGRAAMTPCLGQLPLLPLLSGWKLSPSSCPDDTWVSPCVPLVPFKLLPQCWSSEGLSLGKSVFGFFERNCLELQKFFLLPQFPLVFAARSYGNLSSWHWNLGWGWDSSLLTYPSWIFVFDLLLFFKFLLGGVSQNIFFST